MQKILKIIINLITAFPKYLIIGTQCILNKEKRKKLDLEKEIIPTTITTLSLITYLTSIFLLTRWYVQNERIKNFSNTLTEQTEIITTQEKKIIAEDNSESTTENYQEITPQTNTTTSNEPNLSYLNINFNYYLNKNSETVAWINVNGTNINYPIVKHTDNSYYLEHDFYQKNSSTGWIFVDYRNDFENLSNNTIIYGHNLINRTMFGSLPKLLNKNWFNTENNKYIKISTLKYNSIWQIFSVYKIEPVVDYLKTKFNNNENYQEFLDIITNRSTYNFNTPVNYNDKIITLSTCDDTGKKRVVIHAKLHNIETK